MSEVLKDPTYVLQVLEVADVMKEPLSIKDFCLLLGITKPVQMHTIAITLLYLEKRGEIERVSWAVDTRKWIITEGAVMERRRKFVRHDQERRHKLKRSFVQDGKRIYAPRGYYIVQEGADKVLVGDFIFTGSQGWTDASAFCVSKYVCEILAVARRVPG